MSTALPINVSKVFRLATGREPTVDDYAILDHIFRTERGESDRPSMSVSSAMVNDFQLEQFSRSMILNRDVNDTDLKTIVKHPGLYRLLMYYHLLGLNDPIVMDGWLMSINPQYSAKKIGDITNLDVLDRTQYLQWVTKSNTWYDQYLNERSTSLSTDPRFPIRLIYTPLIAEELRKYPLSTNIHMTLREMIQHESIEYISIPEDVTMPRVDNVEWLEQWRLNETQFYDSIYDVPTPELILETSKFITRGAYGTTFASLLGGRVPMFMKYNQNPHDAIHEYRVGIELNPYYSECPFFMYMYGISSLNMNDYTIRGYQAILDNQSEYNLVGDQYRTVTFSQWLHNSTSLADFISEAPDTFMYKDGQVVDVDHTTAVTQILMAVMCTLKFLWEKIGFVHGDLHLENIQIVRFDTPQVLPLPGYPGRVFNLSAVPVLIDYGFSSVLRPRFSRVTSTILPNGSSAVLMPVDNNLVTDQAYVGDIVKLIVFALESGIAYEDRLDNLLMDTYYHVFTGNQPESESVKKLLHEELHKLIGHGSTKVGVLRNRMIPVGLTTFDPDAAIESFVESVYIPTDSEINREPINYSIDKLIDEWIEVDGLVISTYAGSVIYQLYRDQIELRPRYTRSTLRSLRDLRQGLNTNYISRIEDIEEESITQGGYDERLRDIRYNVDMQYIYREQILELINTTIPLS